MHFTSHKVTHGFEEQDMLTSAEFLAKREHATVSDAEQSKHCQKYPHHAWYRPRSILPTVVRIAIGNRIILRLARSVHRSGLSANRRFYSITNRCPNVITDIARLLRI